MSHADEPTADTATGEKTGEKLNDPYGRRIFFNGIPDEGSGRFVVECSGCGTRRRCTAGELAKSHLPLAAWLPVMKYSHYARCPSCDKRAWLRIGVAR